MPILKFSQCIFFRRETHTQKFLQERKYDTKCRKLIFQILNVRASYFSVVQEWGWGKSFVRQAAPDPIFNPRNIVYHFRASIFYDVHCKNPMFMHLISVRKDLISHYDCRREAKTDIYSKNEYSHEILTKRRTYKRLAKIYINCLYTKHLCSN